MTDPNNSNNLPNPQDLIDQALGETEGTTPPPTTQEQNEPKVEGQLPTMPSMPTELTEAPVPEREPESKPTQEEVESGAGIENKEDKEISSSATVPNLTVSNEGVPLALVDPVSSQTQATEPTSKSGDIPEPVPKAPEMITNNQDNSQVKQKKQRIGRVLGIAGIIVGVIMMGGYLGFRYFGLAEVPMVAKIIGEEWVEVIKQSGGGYGYRPPKVEEPEEEKPNRNEPAAPPQAPVAPQYATKEQCDGCSNGGWLVWRNGSCKVTGSCNPNNPSKNSINPNVENATSENECGKASGGQWCSSVDANGQQYGFCMMNDGSQGNCNNRAVELGYSIKIGATFDKGLCSPSEEKQGKKSCVCGNTAEYCFSNDGICGGEASEIEQYQKATLATGLCAITNDPVWVATECSEKGNPSSCTFVKNTGGDAYKSDGIYDWFQNNTVNGENTYFCEGVTKETFGGCSQTGKPANLNCFCGTVQIDKPNGFESRTMKCGCEKEERTGSSTSTITTPTLMCQSITRTPTTAPLIGDKVTFTCAGKSTPAGAVNLTYKFRYSINSGAYTTLNNKTATTAELTIAACGSYKVQCQTCGTINGAVVCDPVWSGASTQ